MRQLILAVFAAAALGQPALATADGPDAWRVVNVAPNDVLNVRVGPGTEYFVIAVLPHDARGIQVGICVPTVTRDQFFALSEQARAQLNDHPAWCVVTWNDQQLGWVSRTYLSEDSQ